MIGLFSYHTNNIGDDFQSYVLKSCVDANPTLVDRDFSDKYEGPPMTLIANAFMTKNSIPMSPAINPVFLAVWLGPLLFQNEERIAYLKQHEPIGCRDTDTLSRCERIGIDAYFSGCPTVLCEQARDELEVPGSILFVDVDPSRFENGGARCMRQTNLPTPITWATNFVDPELSQADREAECEIRHILISRAELIVTSRIHVALPALGMGKSLIFVSEDSIKTKGRFTALPEEVRRYGSADLSRVIFDPELHRYDISEYRNNVIEKLRMRCGSLLTNRYALK